MGFLACCFGGSGIQKPGGNGAGAHRELIPAGARLADKSVAQASSAAGVAPLEALTEKEQNQLQRTCQAYRLLDLGHLQELQAALGAIEGDGFEARAPLFVSCIQEHLGPSSIVRLFGLTIHGGNPQPQHLVQLAASTAPSYMRPQWNNDALPGRSFTLAAISTANLNSVALQGDAAPDAVAGSGSERLCGPLLMEQALTSKAPVVYQLDRATGRAWQSGYIPNFSPSPLSSGTDPQSPSQSQPLAPHQPHPRDCLADVATLPGSSPITFAALPLTCGRRLVGALWIVVREEPDDGCDADVSYAPSHDDSAIDPVTSGAKAPRLPASKAATLSAASAAARRSLAILHTPAALSQLALSASLALAAAVPGPEYVMWLASAVRRLAKCANLHTLVSSVCAALARHVRWRFHADVTVQSALVPEHDSHVAFMLYPETMASCAVPSGLPAASSTNTSTRNSTNAHTAVPGAGPGPVPGPAAGLGSARAASCDRHNGPQCPCGYNEALLRSKSGVLTQRPHHPLLRRTASQALLPRAHDSQQQQQQHLSAAAPCVTDAPSLNRPPLGQASHLQPPQSGIPHHQNQQHPHPQQQQHPQQPQQPQQHQRQCREADGSGVTAVDDSIGTRPPAGFPSPNLMPASAPAVLFALSAKAFQLSHTMLSRLVAANAAASARARRHPAAQLRLGLSASSSAAAVAAVAAPAAAPAIGVTARGSTTAYGKRVPPGIIVVDTARHVADVRQPSRDICMLMGSPKGGGGGALSPPSVAAATWGAAHLGQQMPPSVSGGGGMSYGTTVPSGAPSDVSSGRIGAVSLVLMGMEVAEWGCVLGLYVAFPSLTPPPLLAAARDSCGHFLSKMFADLVWHKLQSPELGSEFETLRAGVPGSYVSVSRLRDVVNGLHQMRPATSGTHNPRPQAPPPSGPGPSPLDFATQLQTQLQTHSRPQSSCTTTSVLLPHPGLPTPQPRIPLDGAGGGGAGAGGTGSGEETSTAAAGDAPRDARGRPVGLLMESLSVDASAGLTSPEGQQGPASMNLLKGVDTAAHDLKRKLQQPPSQFHPVLARRLLTQALATSHGGGASSGGASRLPLAAVAAIAAAHASNGSNGGGGATTTSGAAVYASGYNNGTYGQLTSLHGLPSGTAMVIARGTAGLNSTTSPNMMLDSHMTVTYDGGGAGDYPRVAGPTHAHALMTVHDLDDAWGMRGIMGALVESIMTTLRASASEVAEVLTGTDLASRAAEGLEDLQLTEVLGQGASGVVLRGMLGAVPVAVKLMEMPDADHDPLSTAASSCLSTAAAAAAAGGSASTRPSPCYNRSSYQSNHNQPHHNLPAQTLNRTQSLTTADPRVNGGGGEGGASDNRSSAGAVRAAGARQASVQRQGSAHVGVDGRGQGQLKQRVTGEGMAMGLGSGGSRDELSAAVPYAATELEQVRARRTLMRNATELAVMRSVSHVNIVQAFAVYDNVILEHNNASVRGAPEGAEAGPAGVFTVRRLDATNPETGGSPICTAIVQDFCDRGSLADVLADRSFPTIAPTLAAASYSSSVSSAAAFAASFVGSVPGCSAGAGSLPASFSPRHRGARAEVDMRGVYLTLLEIALALRHLHARRLVHRDLKPSNVLLKSSPGDPRGWSCKLADFGFALVLDQQDTSAEADAPHELWSNASGPPGGSRLLGSGGSAGAAPRGWCTVQAQACGTVTHMAPEAMIKNSHIDASVDIYSFGLLCWELLCGRGARPFRHLEPAAIPGAVRAGLRPTFTPDVPPAYRRLAIACWSHDPHRRPRAADAVSYIKAQLADLRG